MVIKIPALILDGTRGGTGSDARFNQKSYHLGTLIVSYQAPSGSGTSDLSIWGARDAGSQLLVTRWVTQSYGC